MNLIGLFAIVITVSLFAGCAFASDGPASKFGKNRQVRVVTITQENITKDFVEGSLERLDQAASFKPDLAVLPEVFHRGGAEALPSPTSELVSQWAAKNKCYVVAGFKHIAKGKKYNSAILFDRAGKIVGRFDKIYPTGGELKGGTTPGKIDPPVFTTDFGKIGMQICYDVNWHDGWKRLKEKGAEIVIFPAAYPADRQLSAHAWINKYYVVSATMDRFAAIYDISGDKIAQTGRFEQWVGAEISLDKQLFEIDYHVTTMRNIQAKYGKRVKVTWLHAEDWVTLESLDPKLSVQDIIKEFKLMPKIKYHNKSTKAVEKARAKNKK